MSLHLYFCIILAINVGYGYSDGNIVEEKSGISMACFNYTYPPPAGNTCTEIKEQLRTAHSIQWFHIHSTELYKLIADTKSVLEKTRYNSCIQFSFSDHKQAREVCCGVSNRQCYGVVTSVEAACSYLTYTLSSTNTYCGTGEVLQTQNHVIKGIKNVIQQVNWRSVIVFCETELDSILAGVMKELSCSHLMVTSFVFDDLSTTGVHSFINKMADWSVPRRLYILVICKTQCRSILTMINTYDSSDPLIRTTRHFAEVIIFDTSVSGTAMGDFDNITLDHLAIIRIDQENKVERKVWISIYTLMWTRRSNGQTGRGVSPVGHLFPNGSLEVYSSLFPNLAFGLNGRHFKGTTLEWAPFVNIVSEDEYKGLCFDVFNEISSTLNFTYEVALPPDGMWGTLLDNGSWVGAIGLLQRKETAFVVSVLTVHALRELVMDFTYPVHFDDIAIVMTKTDQSQQKWKTLMRPYDHIVFVCVGISLIMGSLFMYFIEKINPFYKIHKNIARRERFITYQHALWYLYGALLCQGGNRLPGSQTGRTFIGCWWCFTIILLATYSGNLIAFFTKTVDKTPFETLSEMVERDDYKWGIQGASFYVTLFEEAELKTFKAVWKGVKKFNETDSTVLSINVEDHYEKVLHENYAFIGDNTNIQSRMANECRLTKSRDRLLPFQDAFGLPNKSPFTKMFSKRIIKIQDSGLLNAWKRKYFPQNNLSCEEETTSAKPISVVDVQSAFYLIALGVALSVIVLICEKISFPSLKTTAI